MSFLGELYVELKPGRDDEIWVLTKSLSYYSKVLQRWIQIPPGFETDLSSVPRIPFVFWFWGGRAHREIHYEVIEISDRGERTIEGLE